MTMAGGLGSAVPAAPQGGLAHLWGEAVRLLRGLGGQRLKTSKTWVEVEEWGISDGNI